MNYKLIIFEIIGSSCVGILISYFVNYNIKKWIYKYKKKYGLNTNRPIRLKPFDCETCISFWICFSIFIFQDQFLTGILAGAISSILSQIIYKKYS